MSEQPKSGEKFRTPLGFNAIKNGIKHDPAATRASERKPPWLRARIGGGKQYDAVRKTVREHRLSTVCEESHCPNIGECWSNGTATIMLMGSVCTRACRFCAVDTGNPNGWLDADEPKNAAEAVRLMALRYIVLTSVDRDDLDDGGAAHYAACVRAIKAVNPTTAIEALTPDFNGDPARGRDRRRLAAARIRAERRDRRTADASGARSARGLCANARRARTREAPSQRRADENQFDARPRRDRRRDPHDDGRSARARASTS